MGASVEVREILDLLPDFIEEHWPKNDTSAKGGPKTPGRGEATAAITLFVAEVLDPYIQYLREEAGITEGIKCLERVVAGITADPKPEFLRAKLLSEIQHYHQRVEKLSIKGRDELAAS